MNPVDFRKTPSPRWLGFILAGIPVLALRAEVINVTLGDNLSPTLNGPLGGAGTTWNDWNSAGTFLKNSTAAATPVCFITNAVGPHGDWWCDTELLTAGVHTPGATTGGIIITGLAPSASYDLAVASSQGGSSSATTFTLSNGSAMPGTQAVGVPSSSYGDVWLQELNFAAWQDVAADQDGEIHLSFSGPVHGIVNGFQLIGPNPVLASTYEAWAADPAQGLNPTVDDAILQDPDHDGISNFIEFALAGNPSVSSQAILPQLVENGGVRTFEFDRNDAARPPGTTQIVETTTDFQTWTQIIIPMTSNAGITITDQGATDHVSVALPASSDAVFARLRVSR